MARIELENLVKRYADGFVAVHDLSLVIEDGELMILVGPSGCGKSTLLRMVVGLEDITSGDLLIDGERVNDKAPRERNLAMVFQNYALYPHLNVYENIAFPLRLAKLPPDEVHARVERVAEMLELGEHLSRKPSRLSGGQRQRVAMGRAFVRDAKAFLFDEPLSNLDAKLRAQMRIEIARMQRRLRATMIYVTHDQTEAMTLGHRAAVLRNGALQQCASPRELYDRPANLFVAGFIGAPSMNFLPGRVRAGLLELPMLKVEPPPTLDPVAADGRLLVAGIRPASFKTAARIPADERGKGGAFRAAVDVIEWLGTEQYAHVPYASPPELRDERDERDELGGDLDYATLRSELTISLDPASTIREGEAVELWVDSSNIYLFDPRTGRNLTQAPGG